jgi:hypothetical protein
MILPATLPRKDTNTKHFIIEIKQLTNSIRKWKESEFCVLGGKTDDVNHLLFTCPLSEFIWAFVSKALGWMAYPRFCLY